MKRLLLIAALAVAALYLGVAPAPATARPLSGDDASEESGKRRRDGGSRDEEKEEDFRRRLEPAGSEVPAAAHPERSP